MSEPTADYCHDYVIRGHRRLNAQQILPHNVRPLRRGEDGEVNGNRPVI